MGTFFFEYKNQLLGTGICLLVLLILKYLGTKAIKKVGKISDINEVRTRLIIKYSTIGLTTFGIVALILIWGVDIKEIGLVFSSVFAVIGVALFAQWSILSNITAGVILFFSFPFKIGDKIKIMDKEIELPDEVYLIEDIRAFHIHLRRRNGELFTYPNNMMLMKAVALAQTYEDSLENSDAL
ncbi:mechanosensitive ion channel domain-containing protein [Arenibacter sp. F20364]|uniref:mechanosensitive ion channel domain-containing protein n=1 Tax=Arenibacter sp. F20364 TaxID=2926415 RepID=UPI001FF20426|nr:mechanosensitive ion channel domain-containing protein [Arenibacter sp. F20364]MCK0189062.1 mechanosensitive ion channel family protein [Arenibacter sp. F20364]